ncbi:hypothetical protein HNQ51_000797 [Inhella inkyongensis]|uniref:Phenol degradation protein meta n=1 Tax=Inhella inkyongensis TaxID=392593 RepID=A0A840S3U8_9BURK|nr:transporter [Inhella inkyongensis]MBB5203504.1 hypothetical protein [Inhella inkyongensis]
MKPNSFLQSALALGVGVALCTPVVATERGALRALNGAPGAEISSPQFPGLYGQFWLQRYEADRFTDGSGNTPRVALSTPAGTVQVRREGSIDATVFVMRGTWLTEQRVGEGKFGISAALPLVRLKQSLRLTGEFGAGIPAGVQATVQGQLDALARASSGSRSGAADLELMPYVDWQSDTDRLALGLGVVAPTGRFDASSAVNPGAGKFWTLRPLLVAARVWENGLEAGLRATYSINGRNRDTHNRSGQYLAADFGAHYALSEAYKLGLQGFVNWQTTADRCADPVLSLCGKVRVMGLGPSLSFTSEDGRLFMDAKVLKEFGARNRPEGLSVWLRANVRLDD